MQTTGDAHSDNQMDFLKDRVRYILSLCSEQNETATFRVTWYTFQHAWRTDILR